MTSPKTSRGGHQEAEGRARPEEDRAARAQLRSGGWVGDEALEALPSFASEARDFDDRDALLRLEVFESWGFEIRRCGRELDPRRTR